MSPRPPLPLQKSIVVAVRGVFVAFREERNLKLHMAAAGLVILCGGFLAVSAVEWLILFTVIGLTVTAELLNSAIEAVVDLASPAQHELAAKAKDIAAGAVLVAALFSAGIGLGIFVPRLLVLLSR